jgi:hypothetical protein
MTGEKGLHGVFGGVCCKSFNNGSRLWPSLNRAQIFIERITYVLPSTKANKIFHATSFLVQLREEYSDIISSLADSL